MMLEQRLVEALTRLGFDEYKKISTAEIIFSQDVVEQCARNTCGNFGRNYGCPPLAGSQEERQNRVLRYQNAFLISKIVSMVSRKEMEKSMSDLDRIHRELRREFKDDDVQIMGAGPCTVCEKCAALENKPCRFPEKIQYSMEGSGIDVVRLSRELGMTYNAGGGHVGFFTLVLY
ncbi:MAG: DUF2284 domain-containing protein [Peptococcaceae bacterium]|nr:DUF2284 domain-containing protein [Peptococcaceae bacterium]